VKHKVLKKQGNSRLCAVCGTENPFGFESRFYETDQNEVVGIFKTKELQQSFPGRVHGGIISAMLDEGIGRSIWITEPDSWAVTVELNIKYKEPIPLDKTLICVGRVTRNTRRLFEGSGEIILEDGTVAVEATGKFWKMPPDQIGMDTSTDWWILDEEDPTEIEIPEPPKKEKSFMGTK